MLIRRIAPKGTAALMQRLNLTDHLQQLTLGAESMIMLDARCRLKELTVPRGQPMVEKVEVMRLAAVPLAVVLQAEALPEEIHPTMTVTLRRTEPYQTIRDGVGIRNAVNDVQRRSVELLSSRVVAQLPSAVPPDRERLPLAEHLGLTTLGINSETTNSYLWTSTSPSYTRR